MTVTTPDFWYAFVMRYLHPILATALLFVAALAPAPVRAEAPKTPANVKTYTNPVLDRDLPDPGALWADGAYWTVHTTGGPDTGWPLYKSPDLVHWTFVKHLLGGPKSGPDDPKNMPAYMKGNFWAPEIHHIGRRFILTGTATNAANGQLAVVLAVSDKITGPYQVSNKPIVSQPVAVLDSTIFQDDDGKVYFLWKRDSDAHSGVGGAIFLQEMNRAGTGLHPGSKPVKLLQGDPNDKRKEAVWERGLVEAPWVVKRDGFYYLFYSGAFIDTSYSLGVARSKSITGPFTRDPQNPILHNNEEWGGPGHGAFVQDAAGTWWHLYHARHQSKPNYGRVQMLDRVDWTDGWPTFGNGGTPSTTPQPVPVPGVPNSKK